MNAAGHPPNSGSLAPLFRSQAVDAQQSRWHGQVVLASPLSYSFLALAAMAVAAVLIAFFIWGSYTKRSTVSGQVVPTAGLVKVYAPQSGIVIARHVQEDALVRQGDVLFVLSSERQIQSIGDAQAAISEQVQTRQRSLQLQLEQTRQLQRREADHLTSQIAALEQEIAQLESMLQGQRDRTALLEQQVAHYEQILAQGFVSKDAVLTKRAELIDQKSRLAGIERDRAAAQRESMKLRSELQRLPLDYGTQYAAIERQIATTSQELTESESKRQLVITAPESGWATAVIGELGQRVDGNRPLVSIVPDGSAMYVELYAPSSAVGFIEDGDDVLLRYQAYPYQKFGHQRGRVVNVARTALAAEELTGRGGSVSGAASAVPLYRIRVELEQQHILAYGRQQRLKAGMQLEADILQDTRKLYEWALEPLYSIGGKL